VFTSVTAKCNLLHGNKAFQPNSKTKGHVYSEIFPFSAAAVIKALDMGGGGL
jgi:hypothetical protein